ncbi:hypothetical protein TNCV_3735911 [Trichonephila clavipes]|nr:hypothetical protein TNCV_3735911 [Trichonephila clavipes]
MAGNNYHTGTGIVLYHLKLLSSLFGTHTFRSCFCVFKMEEGQTLVKARKEDMAENLLFRVKFRCSIQSTAPTATAGSDVVQSGRPIFDDFFQHLWPYIGNNTANVVFQMVKRLWLIRIDQ